MPINPLRLRELRRRKKLSRQELADKSKISPRQLARLESNSASSGAARERTINQLATALGVEPGVLLDELPMPEATTAPRAEVTERVQVSALLSPEIRLAYDLIKRRYGVNPTTLFNAAPIMFTLLAEGSLLWRREKLKEVEEAADRLHNLGSGHLSFANAAYRAQEGAADEEESIAKCDLFGSDVGQDAFDLGYDPSTNNPFADYLRDFARNIDDPNVVFIDESELGYRPLDGFPVHLICEGELRRISGGSNDARLALVMGYVRLSDIPDDLLADDRTDERAAWLEEQFRAKHAEAIANAPPLDDLLKLLKSDGEEASK